MGCITSRIDWPPKPKKRVVARNWYATDTGASTHAPAVLVPKQTEEDYVIDWPGLSCRGLASSGGILDAGHDEQIGGWANIGRHMEGD